MLGSCAAAHSVDTCNQNDILDGHLFSFLFVCETAHNNDWSQVRQKQEID